MKHSLSGRTQTRSHSKLFLTLFLTPGIFTNGGIINLIIIIMMMMMMMMMMITTTRTITIIAKGTVYCIKMITFRLTVAYVGTQ